MPLGRDLLSKSTVFLMFFILSIGALGHVEAVDWSPTGSMNTARAYTTATPLSSGRVLVTGGRDSDGAVLANSEIYELATGTWSSTGSMINARYNHVATLLSEET